RRLLERAAKGDAELTGIEGIVADLVTAPAETARALEAALGPTAEALVVADRAAANRVLAVLRREGLERVRVVSRSELPADAAAGASNALLQAATIDPKDAPLLGALLGHFDLLRADVAMERSSPAPRRALVSLDGEVMLT